MSLVYLHEEGIWPASGLLKHARLEEEGRRSKNTWLAMTLAGVEFELKSETCWLIAYFDMYSDHATTPQQQWTIHCD